MPGIGAVRILDQVKLFKPGHRVEAKDVREMYGVLSLDQQATKAFITTTSEFAPGVEAEFEKVMPHRLELRDGKRLQAWLRGKG